MKFLYNALILVEKNQKYCIEPHNLLIDNNVVVSIDQEYSQGNSIDLKGDLIVPSFFNIHSHLGESIYKDLPDKYWTIDEYIKYTENHINSFSKIEKDKLWTKSAEFTIEEQFKHGISGFCASRSGEVSLKYNTNNMAGYPIMNSKKLIEFKEKGLQGFLDYKNKYNNSKCSVGVFFHSLYMNDEASFDLARLAMINGGEFFTIHVSEDFDTRQKELCKFDVAPAFVLYKFGLLNEKTILVHCGFTDEHELELIAKSGATIAICPISNNFLNTKMPDVTLLEKFNIPWCISTDGLATGRTFSMVKQAQALKEAFPQIGYCKLWQSMTQTPANLFVRDSYTGLIQAGVEADFLRISKKDITEDILKSIITEDVNFSYTNF